MQISQIEKITNTQKANKNPIFDIEDVKHYLRIDSNHENSILQEIISSVTSEVERKTNLALSESEWKATFLNFSGNYLVMPKSNTTKILSVTVRRNGITGILDKTEYSVSNGILWFRCAICAQVLNISFIAGYTNKEEINPEIRTSMKQRIANIYENNNATEELFMPFKKYRL